MLEKRMEELTNAVLALTSLMESQQLNPAQRQAVSAANASAQAVECTDTIEDTPSPESVTGQSDSAPVTRDDLRSICLKLVRADRANKGAVKAAIAEHGGKLIDDVPEENLAALKETLGAI